MDAEGDVRVVAQQAQCVGGGGARGHQAAGLGDAVLDRVEHASVDGGVHAEVVGVDEQDARIGWEAEHLRGEHGLIMAWP